MAQSDGTRGVRNRSDRATRQNGTGFYWLAKRVVPQQMKQDVCGTTHGPAQCPTELQIGQMTSTSCEAGQPPHKSSDTLHVLIIGLVIILLLGAARLILTPHGMSDLSSTSAQSQHWRLRYKRRRQGVGGRPPNRHLRHELSSVKASIYAS